MSDKYSIGNTASRWRETLAMYLPGGRLASVVIAVLAVYLLVCVILGMYWSIAPAPFDVRDKAAALAARDNRAGDHGGADGRG